MTDPPIRADVKIALVVSALLTLAALAIGGMGVGIPVFILVYLILLYAALRSPLRHSLMVMMFLALLLPNPFDTTPSDVWKAPFYLLGAVVFNHLNTVDRDFGPLSWCSFSGMDICIVTLGIIAMVRNATGSQIDRRGRVPTPKPLVQLAYLSLAAPVYALVVGTVRSGDFHMALWQLDQVMHLPMLFLLFHAGLRGPKDHPALAKVVLAAAGYKALLALYIIQFVPAPAYEVNKTLSYATSHSDTMLFAGAFVLILSMLWERVGRRAQRIALWFIPLIAAGIIANNRRIAWVQVGLVFITVFVVSRDTPLKRRIRRTLWMLAPVGALYVFIGWESGRSIFKPVQIMRSVIDAQSDGSTMWRELENFDLISTIRSHPIFGTGYGHGYDEVVILPQVSYSLERYVPHNSILGLWSFCGIIGYTALTLLWGVGVYLAMRSYYLATDRGHRATAMVAFGAVLIYLIQCWGDLGLGSWTGVFTVAPALAVSGKLAQATGVWGTKRTKQSRPSRPTPIPGHRAEQAA